MRCLNLHSRLYKTKLLGALVLTVMSCIALAEPQALLPRMYVGNDNTPGGVLEFNLPIVAGSTPNFTIASQCQDWVWRRTPCRALSGHQPAL